VALDNYLSAIQSARKRKNVYGEVSALLNIGLLYEGLKNYGKAMHYYEQGVAAAENELGGPKVRLLLLCKIQQAQLLCRMNRYEEAADRKREIDSYYHIVMQEELLLSESILEVYLNFHAGNEKLADEQIRTILRFLSTDSCYLEQIDLYLDFCEFLLEHAQKEQTRSFLDTLQEKLGATEFLHLQMRVESLEVRYRKKYCSEQEYLEECGHYVRLEKEYDEMMKTFRRQNLMNVENLQEVEKRRMEFEIKSKCDLATGLLNKEAFREEVENYLSKRQRNVTDSMVMVDIDNFKLINDSFGHLLGDAVITGLANLIRDAFGRDICGRFGGDEFMIFIRDSAHMEEVEEKVERLRADFHKMPYGRNEDLYNSVSIGVSYNNGVNTSYNTMFSCADEALSKAKEYGKNRVAFYEIKRGLLKYV
jgi:diguanylate cyclase (GGDEF)-like protein